MPDLIVWTIIIAVIAAFFAAAGAFAHVKVKAHDTKSMAVALVIWGVFTGVLFGFLSASSGYDGLLFIFIWLGIGAPTAVGFIVGTVSGWFTRRQTALV